MITHFSDLHCWQVAHTLALLIYKITDTFPRKEQYILIPQMRRCSTSISANVAEGFSRATKNDKVKFYVIAKGSLTELENFVIFARDVGYISEGLFHEASSQIERTSRLLIGMMRSAQSKE